MAITIAAWKITRESSCAVILAILRQLSRAAVSASARALEMVVVVDDDVIEALAPDRADQALDVGIVPG